MRLWALLLLALWAAPAGARELWTDGNGARLEGRAFYKVFLTPVWLPPALVEGTASLQRALDETRALLPEALAAQVPDGVALPDFALLNAHVARAWGAFRFQDKVSVDVAWQATLLLASDPRFAQGASLTGTLGGAASGGAARRLVDFDPVLWSRGGVRLEHNLDRAAVRVALPFGDLTVGRQVLSWGTGRFWNPTDVLSPFPPTVVDREVRRGFDAVRLAVALGDVTQLDLLFLPQAVGADVGGAVRFQTNAWGWDGSLSVGKYARDLLFGADLVGDVGPLGVHAEGAYTVELRNLDVPGAPVEVGEHFFRGVVGVDWKPVDDLVLMLEYHFNGAGTLDPSEYAAKLQGPRAARGEVFGAGMHYAGLSAAYRATDLLGLQAAVLANLRDPSVVLVPSLEYSLEQSVLVRAGASIPIGAAPDVGVFQGLGAQDVLNQSARLERATRTLGLRSEYGASSWSVFLQVGLYAL